MHFEIQAHRGARAFFPENTVQAFCKAADLGVRVIELDLLVSGDHQLVVSHDPCLGAPHAAAPDGRPLGEKDQGRFCLYDMSYAEIAAFGCGLPDPHFPLQRGIDTAKPLIADVFRQVDAHMLAHHLPGEMIFNLELKSWPDRDNELHPPPDVYAFLVAEQIHRTSMASRVRVQSFDDRLLREVRMRYPELCFGFLVDDGSRLANFRAETGFVPAYVNPYYSLLNTQLVERLHSEGVRVVPWTVNRPEEMLRLKRMGADGIITDHPELALQLEELFA
jgi:glycerophosphoryl diester phosphodiesterase